MTPTSGGGGDIDDGDDARQPNRPQRQKSDTKQKWVIDNDYDKMMVIYGDIKALLTKMMAGQNVGGLAGWM